jgi:hypothetical protein
MKPHSIEGVVLMENRFSNELARGLKSGGSNQEQASPYPTQTLAYAERRRLPRFHITPCQFHDSVLQQNFSVQDISLGGLSLRLLNPEDVADFAVGTVHEGRVKLEGKRLSCCFQVRYIRGTLIGGEWQNLSPELNEHLVALSSPVRLGQGLKRFEMPDTSGTTWYHNPVGVDLLLYSQDHAPSQSGLLRWTVYLHHNFVQWESDSGVRTGKALAEADEGYAHGIVRLETRLIQYDQQPDRKLIEAVRDLIQAAQIDGTQPLITQLEGVLAI